MRVVYFGGIFKGESLSEEGWIDVGVVFIVGYWAGGRSRKMQAVLLIEKTAALGLFTKLPPTC